MTRLPNTAFVHLLGLLLFLGMSFSTRAQDLTRQSTVWKMAKLGWVSENGWSLSQKADLRTFIAPRIRRHMFINDLAARKEVSKAWTVGGGLTFARFSLPHDPENSEYVRVLELRPFQTIEKSQKLGRFLRMTNRLKIEQRFFEPRNDEGEVQSGRFEYDNVRFRLKNTLKWKLKGNRNLLFTNESMVHIGDVNAFFDQHRLGIAIIHGLPDNFSLETAYLIWYQRISGNRYFWRNSFRIGVNYQIRTSDKI